MAVMARSPFLRGPDQRVHAKEISFTFYDELVIMPCAGLENGGLSIDLGSGLMYLQFLGLDNLTC